MGVTYAEFGTRRRHSYKVHDLVIGSLAKKKENTKFIGSSNVHFAMKYGVKPIGTHAHEWFMFHAAEYGFKMANKIALDHWVDVYRGDLGVALSDTFTTDVFFNQFDKNSQNYLMAFVTTAETARILQTKPLLITKKTASILCTNTSFF